MPKPSPADLEPDPRFAAAADRTGLVFAGDPDAELFVAELTEWCTVCGGDRPTPGAAIEHEPGCAMERARHAWGAAS